ncbi:hypothetical protein ACOMHN_021261 [Nucella lapillus]
MQGRTGYDVVTAALQNLTLSDSSPQSENEHYQAGKVEEGGALSRQGKAVTEPQRPDDVPDVGSTEPLQGQPLQETPPQSPAGTQPGYEVDGPQTTTTNSSDLEEEKYTSLPATVVGFKFEETTQDVPNASPKPGTPETTKSQTSCSSSSSSESRQPSDGSSEGSGASLGWTPNMPDFKSIMPTSSDERDPIKDPSSVADVEGMEKKGVVYPSGSNTDLNIRANVEVEGNLIQEVFSHRGLLEELTDYLTTIAFNEPGSGICVSTELTPSRDKNSLYYRCNKEFKVVRTIAGQENQCGVFVCEDNTTRHQFVWKKIQKTQKRLIGIEFLTQRHDQQFLPKIYAVFKEKWTIGIFQEFIKGDMLLHIIWNVGQIRELAEQLLTAVHYLHTQGLVHSDIKLSNIMVRDRTNPKSVVLIDFESAEHCSLPFQKGGSPKGSVSGYTLVYLPPWHKRLLNLEEYDELLKTADLWAIACVIIFFLIPSVRSDRREVWSQDLRDIKAVCEKCRSYLDSCQYCADCRNIFLQFVEENGHTILHRHLGHLMESQSKDPDWRAVRQLLQYLTNQNNLPEKHVSTALSLVKGSGCQHTNESDHDINPRS